MPVVGRTLVGQSIVKTSGGLKADVAQAARRAELFGSIADHVQQLAPLCRRYGVESCDSLMLPSTDRDEAEQADRMLATALKRKMVIHTRKPILTTRSTPGSHQTCGLRPIVRG